MRKCMALMVVLLVSSSLVFAGGRAEEPAAADGPVNLVFSTHSVGTGMYMLAAAMAPLIEEGLPARSRVDVETTGGGVSGPMLVGTGQAEIALGNANTVRWLYDGTLEGQPQITGYRAIAGGLDNPTSTMIFTERFINRTGFTTMEEVIENKHPIRIAIKPLGSLGEVITHMILEAYGSSVEEVLSWGGEMHNVDPSDIVNMLRDNRADITFDHVGEGQAATSELALTTPIRFISLSEDVQDTLVEQGFARRTMSPGMWANQDYEVRAVNAPVLLLVNENVSDEVAYLITQALVENTDALIESYAGLATFDPETAWAPDKVQVPLHPGAEQYYREHGLMQ